MTNGKMARGRTMRAAVLVQPGEIRIEERPVPRPGRGEVLVRVKAVGVCGSDVHYFRRGRIGAIVVTGPLVLGHEAAGEVADLGEGALGLSVGQKVSIEPGWPCARCHYCKVGQYNLCPRMRFLATPPDDGALCEYLAVPADFAHAAPESLSFAEAAMIEPLAVGVHACKQGGVRPGDTVLVSGAGPIGLCGVMAALAVGAARVFVNEPDPFRRERSLEFGAAGAFDPTRQDEPKGVKAVMEPGADVLVEASGADMAIQQSVELIAPGGRIVLVGFPHQEAVPLDLVRLMSREATIRTVWRYVNDYPLALHLASAGKAPVGKLITHRYPLERSQEALAQAGQPGRIKAVIEL